MTVTVWILPLVLFLGFTFAWMAAWARIVRMPRSDWNVFVAQVEDARHEREARR